MIDKIYKIGHNEFRLKTDLTLDESERIQEVIKNIYTPDGKTFAGNITGSEIKLFLSLSLEQIIAPGTKSNSDNSNIDFGKATESVVAEILKDFFLNRLKRFQVFTNYYEG